MKRNNLSEAERERRLKLLKVKFENVSKVCRYWPELGKKHKLWDKSLEELVDFFSSLPNKQLRRVYRAFGVRVFVGHDDKLRIYVGAGDFPGLLVVEAAVKPGALNPEGRT